MSTPARVRTMVVALLGTLCLALGVLALTAPTATAAPPSATQIALPFDGLSKDDTPSAPNAPGGANKPDKSAEKAEKLGGGIANDVIDLVTNTFKCALNIATDAVKCSI